MKGLDSRCRRGRRTAGRVVALVLFAGVAGCRSERSKGRPIEPPAAAAAMLRGYADLAFATYSDALSGARALSAAVEAFVAAPSAAGLDVARKAWLEARVPYVQTEVFRFYGGPIDRVETLVNTWPIDESFIDSRVGTPGIVNDAVRYPDLSESALAALNMKEGETSVTTGYHAIEFLLYGADDRADGPGDRPYTDYVEASDSKTPGVARRRGAYLVSVTHLLARHLEQVERAWSAEASSSYRAEFLALPPSEALGRVIKGMGALTRTELAGERLTVAYQTKDQENEHSCFSDNTTEDVRLDATGVENVCTGRYVRADGAAAFGPGFCALVEAADATLGRRLRSEISASVAAARAIPAPFDRAILGTDDAPGRRAIAATIAALEAQARTLSESARVLGAALPLVPTARQ